MRKEPYFLILSLFFASCSQSMEPIELEALEGVEIEALAEVEEIEAEVEVETELVVEEKSPTIHAVKACVLAGHDIHDAECWYSPTIFLDENGEQYPVPAGTVNQAGDGWVYMDSEYQIFAYDELTDESQLLMSVLDTTDGVSFEWSPDDSKLAIVVVNQNDESYRQTYGSKLFMFSFDDEGKMLSKDRYLFKIKYGCHSAGCNSQEGEDFYFVNNDTLVYYTWEGDPYVERTSEYKRTVEL